MISPRRLFRGWWLCRDTGIPADYPPRARAEIVQYRLDWDDDQRTIARLRFELQFGTPPPEPSFTARWLERDPDIPEGSDCTMCAQPYQAPHLGTCPRSTMYGGAGIVGYRLVTKVEA